MDKSISNRSAGVHFKRTFGQQHCSSKDCSPACDGTSGAASVRKGAATVSKFVR